MPVAGHARELRGVSRGRIEHLEAGQAVLAACLVALLSHQGQAVLQPFHDWLWAAQDAARQLDAGPLRCSAVR